MKVSGNHPLNATRSVVTVRQLPDRRFACRAPTRLRPATARQAERGGYSCFRDLRIICETVTNRVASCRHHLNLGLIMSFALLALALSQSVRAQSSSDPTPFGPISEVDVDQLIKFGKERGFDLQPEMERVYKKD